MNPADPHSEEPLRRPNLPPDLDPRDLLREGLGRSSRTQATPPPNAPSIEVLAPLFPDLEIECFVGRGGMGAVYKARQRRLDRTVALKILPPRATEEPAFAERFLREAQSLAKLSHPNIVAVHDFGEAGDYPYLVMEFVDGPNLRQVIETGGLEPRQALEIVPQLCAALEFAHERGVVHRDIKPENVLLDRHGQVKIADFGLAKMLAVDPGRYSLTGDRDVLGTPHYMAPEQFEQPRSVDHRADIYSLGVVFYELLTGELPIGRFAPPSQRVEVDAHLDEIVLRALEKEPERRYSSIREMRTRLLDYRPGFAGPPVESEPTPVSHDWNGPSKLSTRALLGALLTMLPVLSSPLFLWVTAVDAPPQPGSPTPPSSSEFGNIVGVTLSMLLMPVAGVVGCLLGWSAIGFLRRECGRYHGRSLATFAALFYPLGLGTLMVGGMIVGTIENDIARVIVWLTLLVIDIWLIRATWQLSAPDDPARTSSSTPPSSRRSPGVADRSHVPLSKAAVTGFVLVLLGLPAQLLANLGAPASSYRETDSVVGVALESFPLPFIFWSVAMAFGWWGLIAIRRSAGRLRGRGYAVFSALFFPLLAFGVIFSGLVLRAVTDSLVAGVVIGLLFLVIAVVVGYTWRASKPVVASAG